MKRTVAFLDIKNVAVITWTDNHEAELDASIFWNLSPSILQNQFIVLYFHLLVVVIKESKPASVRVKLRNADFLPFWLTFLLPRFSLSSKGKLVFQLLHQRFPNKTIQSFPDRIAANFALSILPEWLESKRIQELAADIAQCAHYAIVYFVPFCALAASITRCIRNHPNKSIRNCWPFVAVTAYRQATIFTQQGQTKLSFHYQLLMHEIVDTVLTRLQSCACCLKQSTLLEGKEQGR